MIVHLEDFQQSEIQFIHVLAGEGGGVGLNMICETLTYIP